MSYTVVSPKQSNSSSLKVQVIVIYSSLPQIVEFYNLSGFQIWPDNKGGLWWEGPYKDGGCVMMFNATFNNISVILYMWPSVLLVEDTVVPGENHRLAACDWQTLSHNVVLNWVRLVWKGFELATLVMKGTGCKGRYKSN